MSFKKIYIIAEAGVNHNGSLELAKNLVDVAVDAGANAVKFQTFKASQLVSISAPKAKYQIDSNHSESQFEMLKKLELDEDEHEQLVNHCQEKNIDFLSSPFDLESVDFLSKKFKLKFFKIASGEITNAPLLLKVAQTGKPIILSTGMSTIQEIKTALATLAFGFLYPTHTPSLGEFEKAFHSREGKQVLKEKVILLHCTSEYPAPFQEVNLRAMQTLHQAFEIPVGFSDHTLGISVSIAAAALGATVIEKHFTLDPQLSGPDHKASLDPVSLQQMILSIREVETALGSSEKLPTPSELKNLPVARRSLVAACDIKKGELFNTKNLAVKRPGTGISPFDYWNWIGKPAKQNYSKDELITL